MKKKDEESSWKAPPQLIYTQNMTEDLVAKWLDVLDCVQATNFSEQERLNVLDSVLETLRDYFV